MCSVEGSAHVPTFSKKIVVYFFTEFDVEINYWKYEGYRIQSYFPSTVPRNAIASSNLLPLYSSTPSSNHRYSYKPLSESENSVEYFRWPRAAVHSLIFLYKERLLKNHYFYVRLAKVLKLWSFDRTVCPNFMQARVNVIKLWSEITSGRSKICHVSAIFASQNNFLLKMG